MCTTCTCIYFGDKAAQLPAIGLLVTRLHICLHVVHSRASNEINIQLYTHLITLSIYTIMYNTCCIIHVQCTICKTF